MLVKTDSAAAPGPIATVSYPERLASSGSLSVLFGIPNIIAHAQVIECSRIIETHVGRIIIIIHQKYVGAENGSCKQGTQQDKAVTQPPCRLCQNRTSVLLVRIVLAGVCNYFSLFFPADFRVIYSHIAFAKISPNGFDHIDMYQQISNNLYVELRTYRQKQGSFALAGAHLLPESVAAIRQFQPDLVEQCRPHVCQIPVFR